MRQGLFSFYGRDMEEHMWRYEVCPIRHFQDAKLEEATRDVSSGFQYQMRTGQYSIGLVVELAQQLIGRRLQRPTPSMTRLASWRAMTWRPVLQRLAAPFRGPPLLGLWHKHHQQAALCRELVARVAKGRRD